MYFFLVDGEDIISVVQADTKPVAGQWVQATPEQFPNGEIDWDRLYDLKWKNGSFSVQERDDPVVSGQEPTPEPPAPTHEEIEAARAAAYRQTVDPITCEINRLRDMGGTAEEIADAEARREAAVAAIKEQYPYPEVNNG